MIYDEIFDKGYDSALEALEQRMNMPDYNIDEIRNELEALYIYEGQAGRSFVKDAEIASSIAAYETFLSRQG